MKKAIKIILAVLLLGAIIGGTYLYFQNEPRPKGTQGSEAEELTGKMLEYVNQPAWDTTNFISWTFPGGHDYVWNKRDDLVQVSWSDHRVLLNTKNLSGATYSNGSDVKGADQNLIDKAWGYFCNDSWWLNPMVKAQDPGTTREKVTLEDGRSGVMVTYTSGGVTPGDAYLFLLDKNGKPTAYQMWVQIIPVGGIEFKFKEWTTLASGAKLVSLFGSAVDLEITNIKSGQSLTEIGVNEELFSEI